MFWNDLLSETTYKSDKYPSLRYIHQNMSNGEWVASNNRVMLIERNGAIPMFETWDTAGNPVNTDQPYENYQMLLDIVKEQATTVGKIRKIGFFSKIGTVYTRTDDLEKVINFIGADGIIKYSDKYIYFESVDKERQAVVRTYDEISVKKNKWKLLDTAENVIKVCDSWEEADNFGRLLGIDYIIKLEV